MSIHVGIFASEVANNTTMFYSIMRAFITKREPEIDTQVPVFLTFLIPGVLLRKDFTCPTITLFLVVLLVTYVNYCTRIFMQCMFLCKSI